MLPAEVPPIFIVFPLHRCRRYRGHLMGPASPRRAPMGQCKYGMQLMVATFLSTDIILVLSIRWHGHQTALGSHRATRVVVYRSGRRGKREISMRKYCLLPTR